MSHEVEEEGGWRGWGWVSCMSFETFLTIKNLPSKNEKDSPRSDTQSRFYIFIKKFSGIFNLIVVDQVLLKKN